MYASALDFTQGFSGDVLRPMPSDDAVKRLCRLLLLSAERIPRLTEVGPWTILLADTLAGRVTAGNVHDFACHIQKFAELLSAVPGRELTPRDQLQLAAVIKFCSFGFAGAWHRRSLRSGRCSGQRRFRSSMAIWLWPSAIRVRHSRLG